MIIKRKSDVKLLNVSDKKVRVYESMYTVPMNVDIDPRLTPNKSNTESKDGEVVKQSPISISSLRSTTIW
jgi:hypothetical protein